MPELVTISKENKDFPENLDFKVLRREGIDHIAKLSGKIWTDHNLHDPGITILEVLCYALTDLGYRTNLDIKDILSLKPGQKEDNFYTPAEILTCNPLTILDYRKMLIDTEGVRNAWIEPATKAEVAFFVNCQTSKLSFDKPGKNNANESVDEPQSSESIKLNGLYKVFLELESFVFQNNDTKTCVNQTITEGDILKEVEYKLHQHRNLCEDFFDITILKEEDIGVCADIELTPDGDPEDVLVEIYNQLFDFFSPNLNFYTLGEMLDKGKGMDEIYEGRPFTKDSFGFIDAQELEALVRHTEIHASDLHRVILNVPGVRAIKNLHIANFIGDAQLSKGEEWCLPLTNPDLYRPVFSTQWSKINFFKGVLPFTVDIKEVGSRFNKILNNFSKTKRSEQDLDGSIPNGQYRSDLSTHYSIQNDFPLNYKVGEKQLPGKNEKKRRAQALQLKGYLSFFDQLLANYLVQLNQVRDSFSMSEAGNIAGQSYFHQSLDTVPDADQILRFFQDDQSGNPSRGQILAIHPKAYKTIIEREEAIRKVIKSYKNNDSRSEVKRSSEGKFQFQIFNGLVDPHLESKAFFDSEEEAREAANELSFLATDTKSYRAINDVSKGEFSFEFIYNPTSYQEYLETITESPAIFQERRNRFLNHLMARFSEHFTEYVLLTYALEGKKGDPAKIIEDKTKFLECYPEISRNRGKSFNYKEANNWNSPNITGLEKRVSKLMGIEWQRSHLNNFNFIEKDQQFFFQCRDQWGRPSFIGTVPYSSRKEAEAACDKFVELMNSANCVIDNIDCSIEYAFGFRVLDEAGIEVAIHPYTYPTEAVRGSRAECLKLQINNDGIILKVIPSMEGFYYYLYENESHDKILFQSEKSYSNDSDAFLAWHNFVQLAQNKDHYFLESDLIGKGFRIYLSTEEDGKPIAIHPQVYQNKATANSAIEALHSFVVNRFPNYGLVQSESVFKWQYFQQDETVLFQSGYPFKSALQSIHNYLYTLDVATNFKHYIPSTREVDGKDKYGFYIAIDDLQTPEEYDIIPLAAHPIMYDNPNERDQKMKEAFEVLKENGPLDEVILQNQDGYCFEWRNNNNSVVLRGQKIFSTREIAAKNWLRFTNIAKLKRHYRIYQEPGFLHFYIEVFEGDQILARSPEPLSSRFIANLEIDRIIEKLSKTNPAFVVTKEEGLFGFCITNGEGEIQENEEVFIDKGKAIKAWLDYQSETEEEAPKTLSVQEIFGSWFIHLKNEASNNILEGAIPHETPEDAHLAIYDFLKVAGEELNYFDWDSKDGCRFGFGVYKEGIEELAYHPNQNYPTTELRNKAKADVLKYVCKHQYPFKIEFSPGKFHNEIWWENCENNCEPILIEKEEYKTDKEAKDAFQKTWKFINGKKENLNEYFKIEQTEDSSYSFKLRSTKSEKGKEKAYHPKGYPTQEEAEKVLSQIIDYLINQGKQKETIISGGIDYRKCYDTEFYFKVEWCNSPSGVSPVFKSVKIYETPQDAEVDLELILDKLQVIDNDLATTIQINSVEEEGQTLFQLEIIQTVEGESELIAVSLERFETEELAIERQTEIITIITTLKKKVCGKIFDENDQEYDEKIVTFQLSKNDFKIARHPKMYKTEKERDEILEAIIEKTRSEVAPYCKICRDGGIVIEGKEEGKRYYQYVLGLQHSEEALWWSKEKFKTLSQAREKFDSDFFSIIELSRKMKYYQTKEESDAYKIELLDKDGNVIAVHPAAFNDLTKAKEKIQYIRSKALSHPIYKINKKYCFRLYNIETQQFEWESTSTYTSVSETWDQFYEFLGLLTVESNHRKIDQLHVGFSFELGETLLEGKNLYSELVISDRLKQFLDVAQQKESIDQFIDYTDECRYRFQIVNSNYRVAKYPGKFDLIESREGIRECLYQFKNCNKLNYTELVGSCKKKGGETYFFISLNINGEEANPEVLWKSIETFKNKDAAKEGLASSKDDILTAAREPDFYRIVEEDGIYTIELMGPDGGLIAKAPNTYNDKVALLAAIEKRIIKARQHPVVKLAENQFGFQVYSTSEKFNPTQPIDGCDEFQVENDLDYQNVTGQVIWESVAFYESHDVALEEFKTFFNETLCEKGNYKRTGFGCGPFSLEIINPAAVEAIHPRSFLSKEELDSAIVRMQNCLNQEGFHVLEHILLRPRTQDPTFLDKIQLCVNPEICECSWLQQEENGAYDVYKDYVPGADPFSFWATIVLPYWPRRFQNSNFREFFESTLRRETPAHIALRIAWVDPEQMKKFEHLYRTWLETMGTDKDCRSTKIQCDLLECLFDLKNVYPLGRLYNPDEKLEDVSIVVLDQTTIG